MKENAFPDSYNVTPFISEETFLFKINGTESSKEEQQHVDYVDKILELKRDFEGNIHCNLKYCILLIILFFLKFQTETFKVKGFLFDNEEIQQRICDFLEKSKKLNMEAILSDDIDSNILYALVLKHYQYQYTLIEENSFDYSMQKDLKLFTFLTIQFYLGETDTPITRLKNHRKSSTDAKSIFISKVLKENDRFCMMIIDPLIHDNFINEDILLAFLKKRRFVIIKSSLHLRENV